MTMTDEEKQELDGILPQLTAEDSDARRWAVYDLEKFPPEVTVGHLVTATQDEHRAVREAASELLEAVPTEQSLPHLTPLLGHKKIEVRNLVAALIAKFGAEAVDALVIALKEGNEDVRKFSADILGLAGSDKAVEGLSKAMLDEVANVGVSATEALGKIRSPLALSALMEVFETKDYLMREAAEAIGLIGDADSANYLAGKLFDTSDLLIQYAMIDAMGNAGDQAVLEQLEASFPKLSVPLQGAAILGLLKIAKRLDISLFSRRSIPVDAVMAGIDAGGEDYQQLLIEQLDETVDADQLTEFTAAADQRNAKMLVALIHLSTAENDLQSFCVGLVDHENDWVAYTAIEQLPIFGAELATPIIQKILAGERNLPQLAAMRAMQELDIPQALEWVRPFLKSEDDDLRSMAEQVLGS
ncbi:MAG: HEAT repeat domain-containing protein [Candidatus Marinimicrobia bacterium]|nr:HEAT repeat domain-containing protein [Candidatus Neomarinimicrobiota bacterium]